MSLNKSIIINSEEGHEYVLGFSRFESIVLPETITKDVIEVVIAIEDNKGINNAKTLFTFTKHIKAYLTENDVILYSYCDSKEIVRAEKYQNLTPQEYRNSLFQTMFDRELTKDFINKPIELTDLNDEKHYIQLFSRAASSDALELAASELYKLGK